MKTCTKCRGVKSSKQFFRRLKSKDGLSSWCKTCVSIYNSNNRARLREYKSEYDLENRDKLKQYYIDNKGRMNEVRRRYYSNHKDEISKQKKQYYTDNKTRINWYCKNRRKCDINYKITCNLRKRLGKAIRRSQKRGSAVQDLGCSIGEFKSYINSKFQDGMTWNNYGRYGWHIDHVIPLSSFNLGNRDEFLKACHYTNLQPLWARDNLSKGSRHHWI